MNNNRKYNNNEELLWFKYREYAANINELSNQMKTRSSSVF